MKQKEELLIDLGRRYRDIINNILDVIVEVDAKGKFIYLSPQVYDMFVSQPEELIGLRAHKFIHPEDLSRFKKAMDKVLKFGNPLIEEFRVKHKRGNYIQISVKGSLAKGNDFNFLILKQFSQIASLNQVDNQLMELNGLVLNFSQQL